MRASLAALIIAGALAGAAVTSAARAAGPFEGRFAGPDGELVLRQNGTRVTGTLSAEGEGLPITGTVAGGTLNGRVAFPEGESLAFVGQVADGGLMLQVIGEPEGAFFRRVGAAASSAPPPETEPDPGGWADPGDPPPPDDPPAPTAPGAALSTKGPASRGAAHEAPYEGWRLQVPRGWKHVERGGALLMGSETEAGLIAARFTPLTEPRALQQGLTGLLGTMGQFPPPPPLRKAKLAGGTAWFTEVAGVAQDGSRIRARAVGVVGKGGTVAILGLTADDDAKMAALAKRVDAVARSVRHFTPKVSPGQRAVAGEWWSFAGGSTATSHGGTERSYGFCRDGTFSSSRESSYGGGIDTGGTYSGTPGLHTAEGGYQVSATNSGRGRWFAVGDARSGTIRVTHADGSQSQIAYEAAAEGDMKFDGRLYGRKAQGLCR